MATASPDIDAGILQGIEDSIEDALGNDSLWAVVILNTDYTTFGEVINACMVLFGYSRSNAQRLADRVHTEGEAEVDAMPKAEAQEATVKLAAGNVKSEIRPLS